MLAIVEHLPSDFVSVEHWIRFWVSFSNRHRTHARLVHNEVSKDVDDEVSKVVDDEVSKDVDEVSKTICTTATRTRWHERKKREKTKN